MARWVSDTIRVEVIRTREPAGEVQSACRVSVPARRSSTRSCEMQRAVAQVERLVVDQQPDQLAVGDVDDRLAGLGVAVAGLGVRQRAQLVERVQVGAGQAVRLALVQVAAQADVPVGQGEHRLGSGRAGPCPARSRAGPRLDRVAPCLIMRSPLCESSVEKFREVGDDDVGAVLAQRRRPAPTRSTPTAAEVPGVPGLDAGQGVLEDRGVVRGDAEVLGRGQEGVRGRLAFRCRSLATWPSTRASNRSLIPAELSTSTVLALDEHDRAVQPAGPDGLDVADRVVVDLDPVGADLLHHQVVLLVAEALDGGRAGLVVRAALGQVDAARLRGTSGCRPAAACRPRSRRSPWPRRTARTSRRSARRAGAGTCRTCPSRPRRARARSGSPRRPCRTGTRWCHQGVQT